MPHIPNTDNATPALTSSSAIAERPARRTSYFDSQNYEVEFFEPPFLGGLGET